ncbi:hypothetical protein D9613_010897 [Agrocybe pediades]|uniref:Uncharacterized protein n=1 Tax=Agrocybe pediades TaxID=84607 RepID=A0A8H4QL65_9AGAR|nr:hypothetical protein D9613_010897 [Agrocybe pediades]
MSSQDNAAKLGTFSVIVGILYMVILGIELFGMFAAFSQKIPFVRMYAYLSGLVVLIVAAASLIQIVLHFTLKSEIINTCTNVNTGDTVFYGSLFGPVRETTLSGQDAQDWCNRSYNRGSWSSIISFLIITFLAAFFAMVAFSYLRQVLDPSHPGNVIRGPNQHRMDNFPSHYNPPYNPTNVPYAPPYSYPAPPGPPPPPQNADPFMTPYESKPPGYVRGDDYKGGYDDMQKGDDGFGVGPSERDVTSPHQPTNPFR